MDHNIYKGKQGLYDYLDPYNAITPMVELPPGLNQFYDDGVRVYLKMMSVTPLGNVKSLPAWGMLYQAQKSDDLKGVDTIVENSSGNTVYSLGILGKLFGISTTKALASHQISMGKLKLLQFFGVQVIINEEPICPDPNDPTSGIFKAKKWSEEQNNVFNPGQYDNSENPNIHAEITGPQIWKQTQGDMQIFCAGLGTTGTMVGAGSFLKKQNKNIHTIGVVRAKNNPVPGPRTRNLLNEVAFDWKETTDEFVEIGTIESYAQSLNLCRNGLLVGPSTGFNVQGLFTSLVQKKQSGKFDTLRNDDGLIHAVVIACDTPFPYLDEYFYYLGADEFPKIENEELLLSHDNNLQNIEADIEISMDEFIIQAYGIKKDTFKNMHLSEIKKSEDIIILDIRSEEMYRHFHIPHAVWNNIKDDIYSEYKNKKVFVVCQRGVSSVVYAQKLRDNKIDAYSLAGGTIDWSYKDFPREKENTCMQKHTF
jgi:cysteine synthase A